MENSAQSIIISQLQKLDYKAQFTSISHISDIQGEFKKNNGNISNIIKYYLNYDYEYEDLDFKAKSILIIAMNSPITIVDFNLNDKIIPVVIPPTYLEQKHINDLNENILPIFEAKKFHYKAKYLPTKYLAVRTGLAQYGKNNISYINGLGSLFRLYVCYTDVPIDIDHWEKVKLMDRCTSCNICIKKCKGGAISKDYSNIDVAKCITFYNERADELPEWIDSKFHNALIGCMDCQIACPENKDYIKNIHKDIQFSKKETQLFLAKTPLAKLDDKTIEKLKGIEVYGFYEIFLRNLKLLIS